MINYYVLITKKCFLTQSFLILIDYRINYRKWPKVTEKEATTEKLFKGMRMKDGYK